MSSLGDSGKGNIPGYAGYVPKLKEVYGMTYGNASASVSSHKSGTKEVPSRSAKVFCTTPKKMSGEDRQAFPPACGYQGFVPRSKEHFGKGFAESTQDSLKEFHLMVKASSAIAPKVIALGIVKGSSSSLKNAPRKKVTSGHVYTTDSSHNPIDERSPYQLPSKHPNKSFMRGYTGFVPRAQNHFGEAYSEVVRHAIEDFTRPKSNVNPYDISHSSETKGQSTLHTDPIPGYTGHIPTIRNSFSNTFGKCSDKAYDNFNHRDEKGKSPTFPENQVRRKKLVNTLPVVGYGGHIPGFSLNSEKAFSVCSKACINKFIH